MPAYFVAVRAATHDPEQMKIYSEKAEKSAGRLHPIPLALYGRLRHTDGEPVDGAVIFTFEAAEAWYDGPEYQEAVVHRLRGAAYRTFIIQGVEGG
ncbi:DUF1330 domain-containing protein [Acerihabitans arboris]|uniref:DUF1330 domain-containing protein n=1 Tax=Acerihabitans arboris TaxID=2691583 RepID=A0A845SGV6_9GAMM|nr:DUF1330 domain-containing protein [Acerihabitans arboris]NDL64100.1 DUF1330 domain-containing protein [Acerihabitans arboris]